MIKFYTSLILLLITITTIAQTNRIAFNNQPIFLNGANVAWINFASDIGNGNTDTAAFRKIFRGVHDYGGNCMRLWLHTNGTVTPQFTGSKVTGPGIGAIHDLKNICDLAYKNDIGLILCLWSFDMMRKTNSTTVKDRNRGILTVDSLMDSYLQNSLVPMIDSLKEHPGIIAWEIFNEPEGMTNIGNWSEIDQVSITNIQKFVNRCAGTIHRADPKAKVTNGAWASISATDVGGGTNYYTDARLLAQGGDADGKLDFYCFHYYDNTGLSPFEHPYSYWGLDKPLVIAEFYPYCVHCGSGSSYEKLIQNGYAGAMGWSWGESHAIDIRTDMQYLFDNYPDATDITRFLKNTPSVKLVTPLTDTKFTLTQPVVFKIQAKVVGSNLAKLVIQSDDGIIKTQDTTGVSTIDYTYTWNDVPEGNYKISVNVTDSNGYSKTADPVYITVGNPPKKNFEAEDATLTGTTNINADASANNGKYVFLGQTGTIKWTLPKAPADSTYSVDIIYRATYGTKNQYIIVNNDVANQIDEVFDGPNNSWSVKTLHLPLSKSNNNVVAINASWGWMDFDYIKLPFGVIETTTSVTGIKSDTEFNVFPTVVNPSGDVTIEFHTTQPIGYFITLTEISGKVARSIKGQVNSGFHTLQINTEGLQPGFYIVNIQTKDSIGTKKIILK